MSALDASGTTLLACSLPGFLPSLITHAIAQGEHGINIGAFPSHATAFEPGLNDEFVRALDHAGTNRPAGSSKQRIAHQGEPFAQITQVLTNLFPVAFAFRQAISQTDKGVGATMFEDM